MAGAPTHKHFPGSSPSGKRLFLTAMTGSEPSTPHSPSVLVGCSSLPLCTTCSQGSLKPSSLRGCCAQSPASGEPRCGSEGTAAAHAGGQAHRSSWSRAAQPQCWDTCLLQVCHRGVRRQAQ